ncbi:hypothetical protein [Gymnodinialimonas hymeniacidonis]|uniref:hypothetical protein n=1 Tax=Gymnodinialimonas hymeniacidonis TaxID=3126508 RepID=UPI0034C5C294
MAIQNSADQKTNVGLAAGAGIVSGIVSGLLLEPAVEVMESLTVLADTLTGILFPMAMSAGLVFGVIGAIFGLSRLGFRPLVAALWFTGSIVGMGAAFYVSILTYDSSNSGGADFIIPYLCASPVGALILGGPLVLLRPYAAKLKLLAALVVLPSLLALGVAVLMGVQQADDALSLSWLIPLYVGWQTLFLTTLAMWRRA